MDKLLALMLVSMSLLIPYDFFHYNCKPSVQTCFVKLVCHQGKVKGKGSFVITNWCLTEKSVISCTVIETEAMV